MNNLMIFVEYKSPLNYVLSYMFFFFDLYLSIYLFMVYFIHTYMIILKKKSLKSSLYKCDNQE